MMPGPLCSSKLGPLWIDAGTLARNQSPVPTPAGMGTRHAGQRLSLPDELPHRLLLAARNGLPFLAPALREQVDALLTLENFAAVAAFIAADLLFTGTGVGTVINVAVGGMAIAIIGGQGIRGVRHFSDFYQKASKASTSEEFQAAGKAFAQGVTDIGVAGAMSFLMVRGARSSGTVRGVAGRTQVEQSWFALAESIEFDVPPNDGVLFAGLSEEEVVTAIQQSKNPQGKIINDTARRYGWTQERMAQDLGKGFSAATYRLWEALSLQYQAALKGRVTAYIDSSKIRLDSGALGAGRGAGMQVELSGGNSTPSVILTELEELMTSNPNISSILVKDIKTGKSWIYSSSATSTMSH